MNPKRINPKKSMTRHIIITILNTKDKDKFLKADKEKQYVTYRLTPVQITVDFSSETMESKRTLDSVLQALQESGACIN